MLVEHAPEMGERGVDDAEARVGDVCGGNHRRGVAVEGEQPTVRAETLEDGAAVSATPKGGVDVDAVRVDPQCVECFVEKDRDMRRAHRMKFMSAGHSLTGRARVRSRSSAQRLSAQSSSLLP